MIKTAIILAGGFGTRLKDVVNDLPKPMAPVNGQPFLNYLFKYVKSYGMSRVIVSTGHLAEKIKSNYGEVFEGLKLIYSHEQTPLGTGGGLRLAMEKSSEEEVVILNGDSFFDVDVFEFYNFHRQTKSAVSLALRSVSDASRYGAIEMSDDKKIISFTEKNQEHRQGLINGGVYIIQKKTFLEKTPEGTPFSIEKDFFAKYAGQVDIYGFETKGYFIDIGIPEDYARAQNEFKDFKYR